MEMDSIMTTHLEPAKRLDAVLHAMWIATKVVMLGLLITLATAEPLAVVIAMVIAVAVGFYSYVEARSTGIEEEAGTNQYLRHES